MAVAEGDLQIHVRQGDGANDETLPADVYIAGQGWLLRSPAVDGLFSKWRDAMPRGGSRFLLDRDELLRAARAASKRFRPGFCCDIWLWRTA